ncbi:MAG: LysR family transcriptional regulator [Pseudomonadota bacterium]
MHLTVRHLEVFNALMEAGSVSNAARRLNVTQPAVSVALANLERELGFRLFQRRRGFFAPTDEALLLHAEAERGLIALDQVRRRATAIRAGAIGGLTVATNGVAAVNLLPRLIADFCENHPGIQVDLRIRSSRRIASLVSEGQADIGLIDAPVPVAGLESRIFRLPCVCILREDDPLSAEPVIRPDLLAGRPIIGITGDHPLSRPCLRTPESA